MLEARVKEGEDRGAKAVNFKHWATLKTATAENSGQDETFQVSHPSIHTFPFSNNFKFFSVSFLCPFYFFQFD